MGGRRQSHAEICWAGEASQGPSLLAQADGPDAAGAGGGRGSDRRSGRLFPAAVFVRESWRRDAAADVAEAQLPAAVLSGADGVCQGNCDGRPRGHWHRAVPIAARSGMAQLACGVAGGDAACDARGGDFVVVPGDADGRRVFGFGSVVLLGQYAVEAGFEESWGNARADAERGGFSFVPGVSCRRDGQRLGWRRRGWGNC